MSVKRRSFELVSLFLLALLAGCASLTGSDGADEAVTTYQATYQAWLDEGEAEDSTLIPDLEQALETITQLGPSAFSASYPEIAESLRALEEAKAELQAAREEGQVTTALREQHERAEETLLATLAKDLQEETLTTQKSGRIYATGTVYDDTGKRVSNAQVKVFYRQRGCGWWWVRKYFDGTTDSSGNYSFYKKHRAFLFCSVKTKNFSVLAYKDGHYSYRETDSTYLKGDRTFNRLLRLNPKASISASNVEFDTSDQYVTMTRSKEITLVSFPVTFDLNAQNIDSGDITCHVELRDSNGKYVRDHRGRGGRRCSSGFVNASFYPDNKDGHKSRYLYPGTYTPELWVTTWFGELYFLAIGPSFTVKYAEDYTPTNPSDGGGGSDPGNGGGGEDGGDPPDDGDGDTCVDENGVPIPCLVPLPNQ